MLALSRLMKIRAILTIFLALAWDAQSAPVLASNPVQAQQKVQTGGDIAFSALRPTVQAAPLQPSCGAASTKFVDKNSDKYEQCPANCPYYAQNREDADHCTFLCVQADECAQWNPNKPIPDVIKKSRTCRGPRVDFCTEMRLDGTDSCRTCQWGFEAHMADGKCYFMYLKTLFVVVALIVAMLTVAIVWFVDLCCRETNNQQAVDAALSYRGASKILQPKNEHGKRNVYSFWTNMTQQDVAGPGMVLHFNFQAFLICWPLFVAIMWTILAYFYTDLRTLGTRKFGTPRHNCILVAWGYDTQQTLMWTKVLFLTVVYVVSFVSFLLFSVYQHRLFQKLDAECTTMKDFAAELTGLPELPADRREVEDDIKKAIEAQTGKTVVGVSVAWNYGDVEENVMEAARSYQKREPLDQTEYEKDVMDKMGPVRKWMYAQELKVLGPADPAEPVQVPSLLGDIRSSKTAFVVFNKEDDKDDAIKVAQEKGVQFDATKYGFERCTLTLDAVHCEPLTVNWQNYSTHDASDNLKNLIKGIVKYYIPALMLWFFVFYLPYAIAIYVFNYENGAEPPSYYGLIFTMVVVGGNATMYIVCDLCAEEMRFRTKDTKQCCYLVMYLIACIINVLLDGVVTWKTSWKVMTGLDFRTYDGTRLEQVETFTTRFETYAMQRMLAENTYAYAFPSTFLIPFLLEPIVTILVPYLIGKLIIRTHREIQGACAEAYIAAFDFDLGRYADIILNVFLGILIFYFPGGYTTTLFYGMFVSHIIIYLFDHWRVLNVIPVVRVVSNEVDRCAQLMLIPCVALVLSSLVFKANCETYSGYCLQGDMSIIGTTTLAGVAHCVVHLLLFLYLVPMLGRQDKDVEKQTHLEFKEVAALDAHSWFSANPVHCLRSQYIHKHTPHCRFSSIGKEHLLELNADIGCFFKDDLPEKEEGFGEEFEEVKMAARRSMRKSFSRLTGHESSST